MYVIFHMSCITRHQNNFKAYETRHSTLRERQSFKSYGAGAMNTYKLQREQDKNGF